MFKLVKLKDVATHSKGKQINGDLLIEDGDYDYLNGGINPSGKWNDYNTEGNTVTISEGGNSSGYVNFMDRPFWCGAHCYYLYDLKIKPKYLYYALKSQESRIMNLRTGATMPNIKKSILGEFEFNINYDKKTQDKVTQVIDNVANIIQKRQQQLQEYDQLIKSRFVEMFGEVEFNTNSYKLVKYGDVFELNAGGTPSRRKTEYWENGTISWIGSNLCQNNIIYENDGQYITEEGYKNSSAKLFPIDTVLVALVGATIGKTALLKFETTTNQNVLGIRNIRESGFNPYFVYYYTQGLYNRFINIGGGGFSMASKKFISDLDIAMVKLEDQNKFAKFVQQVDKLKFEVQKSLDESQMLFDSLMQEYFG